MVFSIVIEPTKTKCVETTAKKMYWSMVDEYLKLGVENKEYEEKIELLRIFLEELDVGKFRSETEELMKKGLFPYLLLEKDDFWNINIKIETKSKNIKSGKI